MEGATRLKSCQLSVLSRVSSLTPGAVDRISTVENPKSQLLMYLSWERRNEMYYIYQLEKVIWGRASAVSASPVTTKAGSLPPRI